MWRRERDPDPTFSRVTGLLRFRIYPEIPSLDKGLTEILFEAVHLMHPLVKDCDDADVAI